ncbi:MAG: RnfABCDGE type electron transport complex subunit D [Ruminococcaceae bacterium]|nr:RnfABCDGE type electron transport complex subunit D [Oscillospiraceae bacterium]
MAQMKYFYELTISSSPHAHAPVTTRTIMRDVLIALTPALLGSVYFFGLRALLVTLVSMAASVLFEWGYQKLMKKETMVYDLSALVTGVLIAFVCPVTMPLWMVVVGDFFAIVVVKQLFGGIGKNFVNPALAARAFLFSWPVEMTTWVKPGYENAAPLVGGADIVTGATPLASMHQGMMPDASLSDLFFGNVGGCIGETSVLLLLIGFLYLLIRRVLTVRIPLAYLGTVAVLALLFPRGNDPLLWAGAQLCAGGLMLGALYMATDYVTSPVSKLGQMIFGIGCGVITFVIRYFGGYNEGVSYAILVMNACVVLLDKIGMPKQFGAARKGAQKK